MMTKKQYNMAVKLLATNGVVNLKELSLEIRNRIDSIYELDLFVEGKKTVLFIGEKSECLATAEEYLNMRFSIEQ